MNNIDSDQMNRRDFIKTMVGLGGTLAVGLFFTFGFETDDEEDIDYTVDFNDELIDDIFKNFFVDGEDKLELINDFKNYIDFVNAADSYFEYSLIDEKTKNELEYCYEDVIDVKKPDVLMEMLASLNSIRNYIEINGINDYCYNFEKTLYKDYLTVKDYLAKNGYNILTNYGSDLVKAIFLKCSNINGDSEKIDVEPFDDFNSNGDFTIEYNDGNTLVRVKAPYGSYLNEVINSMYLCQNNGQESESLSWNDYNADMEMEYNKVLYIYDTARNLSYGIDSENNLCDINKDDKMVKTFTKTLD